MPVRAMGNQLAMTLLSPLALRTASSYASRKASGSAAPLYQGGMSGLNLRGHCTCRKAGAKARSPLAPVSSFVLERAARHPP